MKAIRIHQYGGPEVLAQVEMQRPAPGANEVLIKVHAASVNPVDWKMRAGCRCKNYDKTFDGTALGSIVPEISRALRSSRRAGPPSTLRLP